MIAKYLIHFCAPEVRTMIARLHERPEDFDYGTKWRDLMKPSKHYTWAERMVLRKEWGMYMKNEGRRELLATITKELLDPSPKHSLWLTTRDSILDSYIYKQQLQTDIDPRALYGNNK